MSGRVKLSEHIMGYSFVLPSIALLVFLLFYPMLYSFYLSLFDTSLTLPIPKFLGFEGYRMIIGSNYLLLVVRNSMTWTAIVVVFQFVIGLATAMLLNQPFRGRAIVRGLLILPWVLPGVIAGMVWRLMYDPQLGIINYVLLKLGLIKQYTAWLGAPETALFAVIVSAIWKGFPFSTVMYLAALQTVPRELCEAAQIDGAGPFHQFRYVVIPQIGPVIRITLLLTSIWTFNYFELVYVMTGGGPQQTSHIFPTYIYQLAFKYFQFGDASRYAVINFLILCIFSLLYIRELNKRGAL